MHFLLMCVFAAAVATVLAVVDPERHEVREKAMYGAKVFGTFVAIGIVIGWVMYFIPY